ncbi:hypothetical protein C8Q75DRAFT_867893 [Abortiporus biennis]|nr:hypothetical protein C8Q75DRAFT_867893 [Abortiporus biennis]
MLPLIFLFHLQRPSCLSGWPCQSCLHVAPPDYEKNTVNVAVSIDFKDINLFCLVFLIVISITNRFQKSLRYSRSKTWLHTGFKVRPVTVAIGPGFSRNSAELTRFWAFARYSTVSSVGWILLVCVENNMAAMTSDASHSFRIHIKPSPPPYSFGTMTPIFGATGTEGVATCGDQPSLLITFLSFHQSHQLQACVGQRDGAQKSNVRFVR